MASATYPEWMRKGRISSAQLKHVYTQLMTREHARMELRRASRVGARASKDNSSAGSSSSSAVMAGVKKITHVKNLVPVSLLLNEVELSAPQKYYSVRAASQPENRHCNRYSDIEPYDRTRVLVGSVDRTHGRYLNASWVREVEGSAWWIAAQAPLLNTTHAFLSLLTSLQPASLRPRVIVQLTPIVENGIRKADQYIPDLSGSGQLHFFPEPAHDNLPSIQATIKSEKADARAGCVIRKVELKLLPSSATKITAAESFDVTHIDYHGWPDHSIPRDPNQLVYLARIVAAANTEGLSSSSPTPPVLCHCSAGVGRTGTFIAISSLLRASGHLPPAVGPFPKALVGLYPSAEDSPLGPLPRPGLGEDPVAREVDGLREQRTTMVQRSEQLGIVYQIMIDILAAERRG